MLVSDSSNQPRTGWRALWPTVPVLDVEIGDIVDPVLEVHVARIVESASMVHLIGVDGRTLEVPVSAKVEVGS